MLADLRFRLRALFNRAAMERELDDELRFHIEHETDKLVATGLSRAEAERRARVAFGGVNRIKDDTRDSRGINVIETLRQDVRYAWCGIVSKPGFAAAIILALALGIGANAAMFGIVDRLLFRPPPFLVDADRVHRIYLTWTMDGKTASSRITGYTRYTDLARWTSAFDKFAVAGYRTVPIGDGEAARDMTVCAASASFFDLFDARPVLGRFYSADEDRTPTGAAVTVLTYGYWQSQFGGRADVIGQRIHMGRMFLTVIGVAPRGFAGITDDKTPAAIIPVTTLAGAQSKTYYTTYNWGWLEVFAHRKPDVSLTTADADLSTAFLRSWEAERILEKLPSPELARPHASTGSIHLGRGPEASTDSRVVAWIMGVAAIVLLVACANVANLLLARAVSRRREIALRVALGVSRTRLVQQLATESILLAGLGGIAGLLMANWGGPVLRAMFLHDDQSVSVATDIRTLWFVAAATVGVAILTGLTPAAHALRGDVSTALKGGARDGGYRRSRTGTALLLFQGALSVVLLVGAGLFVRSLSNVRSMRLGYDVDPIVYLEANMRGVKLSDPEMSALDRRIMAAVESTPGVTSAAQALSVPFYSTESRGVPRVPGKDSLQRLGNFLLQAGSPSYFRTVGTRILRGRGFEARDGDSTQHVAVISQSMANAVWPGEDALGKQFQLGPDTSAFIQVIGIAENMRASQITTDEIWYYLPIGPTAAVEPQIFARVTGRPEDFVNTLRKKLQPLMPGASYIHAMPLKDLVTERERAWEFGAKMFTAFGGLALILAAIGLYSVIPYAVAQRTRELGVRIALGASSASVLRMIVGQGVTFALFGIAIGSVIALASGRWIEPMLFAQSARDPAVFIAVGAVLLVVAIIASAQPAIRAMQVDPSEVLRSD